MKSDFPKRVKRHSKRLSRNANAKFDYYVLVRKFPHMNKRKYIYVHIYEELFSKA